MMIIVRFIIYLWLVRGPRTRTTCRFNKQKYINFPIGGAAHA